ncbi:MAG: MarR family transcriptional regulator [Halobacteriales archaeon]
MPVQFDEYESSGDGIEWTIREGSNAHRILAFLLDHPEKGFTPNEIADGTDIPKGSVGPTLQRLKERDLVRHKQPYWSAARDDRIASYEAILASMETLRDRYGDEGWRGVDPEEHSVGEDEIAEWRSEGDARAEDEGDT